jgi:DNA-binding transcriptional regulator YiaG
MDLKKVRKNLNFSQVKMAHACGVHPMTYAKWERRERTPGNAAIQLINVLQWLDKQGILKDFLNSR